MFRHSIINRNQNELQNNCKENISNSNSILLQKSKQKMNNFRLVLGILLISLFLGFSYNSKSSELRLVRTDVDSTRDTVITASYNFSVDFYIDDIENCNSAAFQIRYTNANNIKLSSYKIGDFGDEGRILIVPPANGSNPDESIIRMAVTSARPIGENEFDNPKLLTLEFTVLQSAKHKQKMTIEFLNANATAYIDSIPTEVKLNTKTIEYTIHSYVNVFPGDADNNGIVDINDWTKIDLFTSIDPVSDKSRRFKRKNASTMWTSQLVLAWDNEMGTYADCDGDGSISVSDAIVVVQNDAKTHSIFSNGDNSSNITFDNDKNDENNNNDNGKNKIINNELQSTDFGFAIPIQSDKKYKALEIHLDFNKIKNKLNLENQELYSELVNSLKNVIFTKDGEFANVKSETILDKRFADNGILKLVIASFDYNFISKKYDVIGNIVFQNIEAELQNKLQSQLKNIKLNEITENIYGIDNFGNKFEINPSLEYTTVEKTNQDIEIYQFDNILNINTYDNVEIKNIKLFNTNGEMTSLNLNDNLSNFNYDLENLNLGIGVYFIRLEYTKDNKIEYITHKILIK
jgi:hypothetical protein